MEMLFGLPAHPLITHFPVVGIPLVAIASIVLVIRPQKLDENGLLVAGFSILTAIATILAASSGEALAELLTSGEEISKHRELGETLRTLSVLQTVTIIGMVGAARRDASSTVKTVISVGVVITSILALIWVIRTGHEGASQSWGFLS